MPARLQVLLAAICFGTTGTAQAIGPAGSPVAVGAARIVFGGLLLVLVARGAARAHAPGQRPAGRPWRCAVAVYQLSFFAAVRLTGVAVGTVVAIGTGPAAAGALGRLVNGERLSARWAQATVLAAIGVAAARRRRRRVGRPHRGRPCRDLRRRVCHLHGAQQAHARRGRGARRRHGGRLRRRRPAPARPRSSSPGPASSATPGGLAMVGLPGRRPHRAGLRALLARAAPPVQRRDRHDRPRRAAHRGRARGRRPRRAAVARGRRRRAARARGPARPRGARSPAPRARGGRRHERDGAAARLDRRPADRASCASGSSPATSSPASASSSASSSRPTRSPATRCAPPCASSRSRASCASSPTAARAWRCCRATS